MKNIYIFLPIIKSIHFLVSSIPQFIVNCADFFSKSTIFNRPINKNAHIVEI